MASHAPPSTKALKAVLTRRLGEASPDSFANPFLLLGLELGQGCADGRIAADAFAPLVAGLAQEAFEARAGRLAGYLGQTDPGENRAALERLFDEVAANGDFEAYAAATARAGFGIVLTGHPTFAMSRESARTLAVLATGREPSGDPLSDSGRARRLQAVAAAPPGPPAELTLAIEHDWSVEALRNVWSALETALRASLAVARRRWPDRWKSLSPSLLTVATWVGFDQDGRTDTTWMVSIDKRLALKAEALALYRAMVAPLAKSAADDWAGALAALSRRLDDASAAVSAQVQALAACRRDVGVLPAFSRAMVELRDKALVDSAPLLDDLDAALAHAPDEGAAETLVMMRALVRAQGVALAQVHVRLNADQLLEAVRQEVGLETPPADPANRRTYFARINALIDEVTPATINFGSLAEEPSTARRLMMTVAQMAKFIDGANPVRFLIAETESGFTLLSALYLARMFGVERQIEISPLFETEDGLDDGESLIEEALRSPHFRACLEAQGRIAIEFGFSDSGRFIGQMAATFRIERLRLRLAQLLQDQDLSGLQVIFFNTHGESIGRGGHPASLADRFRYAAPPHNRAEFARRGIRLKEEDSFQGGEGYLPLFTPAAALATVRAALESVLGDDPEAEGDPIYEAEDFASEFFASIQQAFTDLVADPDYAALLDLFGTHLLTRTGSRPEQRQETGAGAVRRLGEVSELRAIPNNALLQQLGYLANTLYGVGPAAARNPQIFRRMHESSPRFRRAIDMVAVALELSDIAVLRAYAAMLDPTMWLDRAAADGACLTSAAILSRLADGLGAADELAGVLRLLLLDALELRQVIPTPDTERRRRLLRLHAVRIALIQQICLLAVRLPDFPSGAEVTRETVQEALMRLDVPAALLRLSELFPLHEAPLFEGADFGEPATYDADRSPPHSAAREALFGSIRDLYGLALQITSALDHEIGAFG